MVSQQFRPPTVTYLIDSSNLDTTLDNLSLHLLTAILVELGLFLSECSSVHLTEERHHLGVQHRREQVGVQCGMSESFLKAVPFNIPTFRMHLRQSKFFLRRVEVPEVVVKDANTVELVGCDNEDGRDSP